MFSNGKLILTINGLCQGSVGCITVEIQNGQRETIVAITENAVFTDKHIQDYSALLIGLREALRLKAKIVYIELNNPHIINWIKSSTDIPQTGHLDVFHEEVQELLDDFEEVHWKLSSKNL